MTDTELENARLKEHNRLLFQENGRLLQEKESHLWDTTYKLHQENARLREDNQKLKQDVAALMADKLNKTPTEAIDFMNTLTRLREALEFYADANYLVSDLGKRARDALGGKK